MPSPLRSSRRRYRDYLARLKQRRREKGASTASGGGAHGDAQIPSSFHGGPSDSRKNKPRSRSFFKLLGEFWRLLAGYQRTIIVVLLMVSFSTLLGLVPLYGTKIVFDNVLREQPLP